MSPEKGGLLPPPAYATVQVSSYTLIHQIDFFFYKNDWPGDEAYNYRANHFVYVHAESRFNFHDYLVVLQKQ